MKEIILKILQENTIVVHLYTGGGPDLPVVAFANSEECDKDEYLILIAEKIEKELCK